MTMVPVRTFTCCSVKYLMMTHTQTHHFLLNSYKKGFIVLGRSTISPLFPLLLDNTVTSSYWF